MARKLFVWRNPLARLGDRLESAVAVGSVTVALLGLPVAAAFGSEVYVQQAALSSEQSRTRHQVDAVLLEGTPGSAGGAAHNMSVTKFDVPATWTLPDGTARRGEVQVTSDVLAGSGVRIWVDDSGARVAAPLTAEGAVVTAVAVATGSWLALGGALVVFCVAVRCVHTRLRRHRWELEWAAVEPGWRKLA
ncbi:hypothetical protein AB0H12_38215 [Actinosynnema sp. NPDC023794]